MYNYSAAYEHKLQYVQLYLETRFDYKQSFTYHYNGYLT